MIFNYMKFPYTAKYRGYEIIEDPNTGASIKQYLPYEQRTFIEVNVVFNALGQAVFHTKEELQNDGLISFLFKKGFKEGTTENPLLMNAFTGINKPVMGGGLASGPIWRIVEGLPVIDHTGRTFCYKYRSVMIYPELGSITDEPPTNLIALFEDQ